MLSSTELDALPTWPYFLQLPTYLIVVTVASALGAWDLPGGGAVAAFFAPAVAIVAGSRLRRWAVLTVAGVFGASSFLTAYAIATDDSSTASLLLLYVPPVTIPLAMVTCAQTRSG